MLGIGLPTMTSEGCSTISGFTRHYATFVASTCRGFSRIFTEDMMESQKVLWERWNRAPKGLKPSLYQAVGGALNFRRVLLGDPTDKANVFAWAEVVANIPGSRGYVVGKPWEYKRRVDGFIASDVCIYVDDGRSTGKDEETAWRASSKFAKTPSFLGLQDAAWKRMAPSQDSEPWFGAKASTTEVGVFKSVADERWMKMKRILTKVEGTLLESKGSQQVVRFPFGQFRRDTGFLVYVMGTYAAMTPYLKGFFLTLYGWRSDRDIEGWKMKGQLAAHQMEREGGQEVEDNEAPELIEAVSRLNGDVTAMLFLAEGDLPRKVQVRHSCSARVHVGFGDAAKAGYGMAVADVSEANQVAVSSMELTTASGDTMTLTDDSPPVHAEY
jgi:hypothetical protein